MSARSIDWLTAYTEYTENTESPSLYHVWVGLGVLSAVLQRRVYHEFGFQRIYPNLYIVLVGPPGRCRKGTALGIANDLLRSDGINVTMPTESTSRRALVNTLGSAVHEHMTQDGMTETHHSMTIFSEELGVFMGEHDSQLMEDLMDWFDCRKDWGHSTSTQGRVIVENVCVTLVAGTTPHYLENSLPSSAVGQGLASRMIFVVEEKKSKIIPFPSMTEKERDLQQYLISELQNIRYINGEIKPDQSFLGLYKPWYTKTEQEPPLFVDPNFEGYLTRRSHHLRKLSMISSISRGDGMVMTEFDFYRALSILEETEKKMDRAFGVKGEYELSGLMYKVGDFLVRNAVDNKSSTSFSQLMRHFYRDCSKMNMEIILDTMMDMKEITMAYSDQKRERIYRPNEWYIKEKEKRR